MLRLPHCEQPCLLLLLVRCFVENRKGLTFHKSRFATFDCERNIEMTPLSKLGVTLPGVRGASGVPDGNSPFGGRVSKVQNRRISSVGRASAPVGLP
jgi:hypothetical protein